MDKKSKVKKIFDSIAYRYDFLNHLLSFGFDIYWRRKAIGFTKISPDARLLDIACGTGDFAITAKKLGAEKIFGADLSVPMLKLFSKKAGWINGKSIQSTAEYLPFKNESLTNIIVAFGVRNFYDLPKAFNSVNQVLKQNGNFTILEFRLPGNIIVKQLYRFYFNKILPFIGGIISKDKTAYSYLPESVNEFDEKIRLDRLLNDANFSKVQVFSLTFGIVQVVIATK
jgi:demethylmenaquinone methyltransferase / 2-methoxy-6-polyprenyl-1,4-benzoquinol methylase